MVLRYGGEALIQHVFERVMICPHDEGAAPKVRPPVSNRLDQSDELALIGCHLEVRRREGPTEEGEGRAILVKNHAETGPRRVTIDNERRAKVL
jgi:hypothetical protein